MIPFQTPTCTTLTERRGLCAAAGAPAGAGGTGVDATASGAANVRYCGRAPAAATPAGRVVVVMVGSKKARVLPMMSTAMTSSKADGWRLDGDMAE